MLHHQDSRLVYVNEQSENYHTLAHRLAVDFVASALYNAVLDSAHFGVGQLYFNVVGVGMGAFSDGGLGGLGHSFLCDRECMVR
jgi:hypothetical protein